MTHAICHHARLTAALMLSLATAACGGSGSTAPAPSAQANGAANGTANGTADGTRAAPVAQEAPNAPGQKPAFAGQTRVRAADSGVELRADRIARFEQPWAMALLPDGSVLVTELGGKLYLVTAEGERSAPLTGVPAVAAENQGGLLDIALAPDFATSRRVYFSYSEPLADGRNRTALARGELSDDRAGLADVEILFRQQPAWDSSLHFGSNIAFDGTGHLFLTLGERGYKQPRQLAQDTGTHLGKVVRLTLDGAPASGNPLADQAGAQPEIWSWGHRNPQGAAIHPDTGRLWTIEHGPQGGDELNVPQAGKNYGWPVITYGENYDGTPIGSGITAKAGMQQPIYFWDPVIAPGDMTFYTGAQFPDWQGDLLIASLNPGAIVRLELDGQRVVGEERLLTGFGRVRDIEVDRDGSLLVLKGERRGGLYRVLSK